MLGPELRALNGAIGIACENITSEHIDPFEGVVVSHAAHEPFIHLCEAPPSTLLPDGGYCYPGCWNSARRVACCMSHLYMNV